MNLPIDTKFSGRWDVDTGYQPQVALWDVEQEDPMYNSLKRFNTADILKTFGQRFKEKATEYVPWREWTKLVCEVLREIGRENGFKTYDKEAGHEYLVDHCWCVFEGENYKGISLAVECEWACGRFGDPEKLSFEERYDEIEFDFDKLIDIKSPWKLFLYHTYNETERLENGFLSKLLNRLRDRNLVFGTEIYSFIDFVEHRRKDSESNWEILINSYEVTGQSIKEITKEVIPLY